MDFEGVNIPVNRNYLRNPTFGDGRSWGSRVSFRVKVQCLPSSLGNSIGFIFKVFTLMNENEKMLSIRSMTIFQWV